MPYALKEALNALRRSPGLTLLSVLMIGLSLLVIGLFGLITSNIQSGLDELESRVEIVAFIKDDADYNAVRTAQQDIDKQPEVRETRYISRAQALEIARQELPEFRTVFGGLERNPLPASIEISLHPGQRGPEVVKRVADRIGAYPFVEQVSYGQDWLGTVYLLRRAATAASMVLGLAFALVAALIIGAAVRMAIFARRDEIIIMRLVGATDGFVRRPFVIEGLGTGLLGAALALVGTYVIYNLLTPEVFKMDWLPDIWVIGMLLSGMVLGAAASAIAVRRHLREIR
ncbi:MAG TPA: permease-like cell division protein FtsX [Longimicrobiales bacterium]